MGFVHIVRIAVLGGTPFHFVAFAERRISIADVQWLTNEVRVSRGDGGVTFALPEAKM